MDNSGEEAGARRAIRVAVVWFGPVRGQNLNPT